VHILETSLNGAHLLTIKGEVDQTMTLQLTEAAGRALSGGGTRILIDLEECQYLDSAGLNVVLGLVREVGPLGWVGVVHPARMVLRLFELVGLTPGNNFRIFDSLDEAGRAVAAP
jgi:anti-anti-sigma factor